MIADLVIIQLYMPYWHSDKICLAIYSSEYSHHHFAAFSLFLLSVYVPLLYKCYVFQKMILNFPRFCPNSLAAIISASLRCSGGKQHP